MASEEALLIERTKVAQALGKGLRQYFMSQFVPGAQESDVDYECVTEGEASLVRFTLKGVNSKLFSTVSFELRLDHSS